MDKKEEILSSVNDYLDSSEVEKLRLEADTLFKSLDYEKALQLYYAILEKIPDGNKLKEDILEKVAVCYEKMGDDRTALKFWEEVLLSNSFHIEAQKRVLKKKMGGMFFYFRQKLDNFRGNYAKALEDLEKNKDLYRKKRAEYNYLKAFYLDKLGKKEEALEYLKKAYGINPSREWEKEIILLLQQLKQKEELQEFLQQIKDWEILDDKLAEQLGDFFASFGKDEISLKLYQDSFSKNPTLYSLDKIYSLDKHSFLQIIQEHSGDIKRFSQKSLDKYLTGILTEWPELRLSDLEIILPFIKSSEILLLFLQKIRNFSQEKVLPLLSELDIQLLNYSSELEEELEKWRKESQNPVFLFLLEQLYLTKIGDVSFQQKYVEILKLILKKYPLEWDYWDKYFQMVSDLDEALKCYLFWREILKNKADLQERFLEQKEKFLRKFFQILRLAGQWHEIGKLQAILWEREFRPEWLAEMRIEYFFREFELKKLDKMLYRKFLPLKLEMKILDYLQVARSIKLVVSACLVGFNSTYRGDDNFKSPFLIHLINEGLAYPVCPEMQGGLATPRIPSEIIKGDGKGVIAGEVKVVSKTGIDVTEQFVKGSREAYRMLQYVDGKVAVLKSKSPSCGIGKVYDGTFSGNLTSGEGVFVAYLQHKAPTVKLFNYTSLQDDEKLKQLLWEWFIEHPPQR